MFRLLILSQIVVLATTVALQAQTTAKVLEVDAATAAIVPTLPRLLLVGAKGQVSDPGWDNARLVPYVYVVPPADGIWDFDFVADRIPGPHIQVLTPVFAFQALRNPPDWVKGVRIHSSTNSKEAKLAKQITLDTTMRKGVAKAASISIEGRYEREGSRHCLIADADVQLGPINKTFELGRFCIDVSGNCVSGEKGLGGGVDLKWRLCIEDGSKLCLYAKACKDFGFPIGEQCTPEGSVCVEIQ